MSLPGIYVCWNLQQYLHIHRITYNRRVYKIELMWRRRVEFVFMFVYFEDCTRYKLFSGDNEIKSNHMFRRNIFCFVCLLWLLCKTKNKLIFYWKLWFGIFDTNSVHSGNDARFNLRLKKENRKEKKYDESTRRMLDKILRKFDRSFQIHHA